MSGDKVAGDKVSGHRKFGSDIRLPNRILKLPGRENCKASQGSGNSILQSLLPTLYSLVIWIGYESLDLLRKRSRRS